MQKLKFFMQLCILKNANSFNYFMDLEKINCSLLFEASQKFFIAIRLQIGK